MGNCSREGIGKGMKFSKKNFQKNAAAGIKRQLKGHADILDGMESVGSNEFAPTAKNGDPYLIPGARLVDHTLEMSGVDTAEEVSRMIETQRAYSYALKMVQTSDEVMTTINGLRS